MTNIPLWCLSVIPCSRTPSLPWPTFCGHDAHPFIHVTIAMSVGGGAAESFPYYQTVNCTASARENHGNWNLPLDFRVIRRSCGERRVPVSLYRRVSPIKNIVRWWVIVQHDPTSATGVLLWTNPWNVIIHTSIFVIFHHFLWMMTSQKSWKESEYVDVVNLPVIRCQCCIDSVLCCSPSGQHDDIKFR